MTSARHRLRNTALLLVYAIAVPADAADTDATPDRPAGTVRPLTVVHDRALAPFAYLDDDARPRGLLIDLWRAVGAELERPVRFELTDWQQTLERVRESDARIHGGLFHSRERDTYLDYSTEIIPVRTALFVAAGSGMMNVLQVSDLAGEPVGVTAGGYEESFMRAEHPDVNLVTFPNNDRLVQAATRGDVAAFAADYPVGMYYLGRYTTPDRFRVLEVLYTRPLTAAVAANNAPLLDTVNRGLAALSEAEKARIVQKWMRTEQVETMPAWLAPALAAAVVVIVLLWLLLHNRLLRRQVAAKTHELLEHERRLSLLTDNISDVVWAVGADRRYTYVSPSIERLTGYRTSEIIARRMGMTITQESVEHLTEQIRQARQKVLRGEQTGHVDFTVEAALLRKDGSPVWTEVASRVFFDDSGRFIGMQGVTREITERRRSRETIERLAYFDALTQLPNRRLLNERLNQARSACAATGDHGALLFLDLDNFKTLNDTQGHDVGDLLLQHVAERLSGAVRDSDTVARLGGDEFVLVLPGMGNRRDQAVLNTERLGHKLLARLTQPYTLAGRQLHTSPSIGATVFDGAREPPDTILKQADMAMYEAKLAGRNTFRFYAPHMQAALDARATLERDLRAALEQDQFSLYYQPQVDGGGHVTGAEALIRWHHPQRGLIPPAEFIALAEETGLIAPVGHWVLEQAARQLADWGGTERTASLTLSVNVSARQFEREDFVDEVLAVVAGSGAEPERLKLELTESAILRDVEGAIARMRELRNAGVGFALDDFGTGYSSLSYLKRLPLDQLKIDKSFVHHVLTDEDDAAIAQTVIALGHMIGLPVIAEGVETPAQRDFLAAHGCDAFQGFLFGAAQPLEAFINGLSPPTPASRCGDV